MDSKGRVSLPREIREMLGSVVELKPVGKGKVLLSRTKISSSKKRSKDGVENFSKLLDKQPRRTGKPENPDPQEMKSIWVG